MSQGTKPLTEETTFCIVGEARFNLSAIKVLERKECSVRFVKDLNSVITQDDSTNLVIVLADFDDESYIDDINAYGACIIGCPVLLSSKFETLSLSTVSLPLFCFSMSSAVVCFSEPNDKRRYTNLIHFMGGSVQCEFNSRITHLICDRNYGDTYQKALSFGSCSILREEWITECWNHRHDSDFDVNDPNFLQNFTFKPFQNLCFYLSGFNTDDASNIEDLAISNGAKIASSLDSNCTHIIVNDSDTSVKSFSQSSYIVSLDWFYACINMNGRTDERSYLLNQSADAVLSTPLQRESGKVVSTRKRKLLNFASHTFNRSPIRNFASETKKRRSSCISHKDFTNQENINNDRTTKLCKRFHSIKELCETEHNYIRILETLIELFRNKLLRVVGTSSQIISATEINHIFGPIEPIYNVHLKIYADLQKLIENNPSDGGVGKLFLERESDFVAVYPPFISFIEEIKTTITNLKENNPRFAEFLKACEAKKECLRQTLLDLLIRPVQRLPSIILLLEATSDFTPEDHPDYGSLQNAVNIMKTVTSDINKKRAIAEEKRNMLMIYNDILSCPPRLLSNHRYLVKEVGVSEVSNEIAGKGSNLIMFIFSDCIEFARPKNKSTHRPSIMRRSVAVLSSPQYGRKRHTYKHVNLIYLIAVIQIYKIIDEKIAHKLFGMMFESKTDSTTKTIVLRLNNEEKIDAWKLCEELSNSVMHARCLTDPESVLRTASLSDLTFKASTLAKRVKTQFHKGLSRVFSLHDNREMPKIAKSCSKHSITGHNFVLSIPRDRRLTDLSIETSSLKQMGFQS